MAKYPKSFQALKEEHPRLWQAYEGLGATAATEGPLDQKTRELIKLGMAAAVGSESAVRSHTHRALEAGAVSAEIEHAILLGITTMGFPTMMAALSWTKAAMQAHEN